MVYLYSLPTLLYFVLQSSSTRATESAIGDDNSKDDEEENEDEDDEKLVKTHNYDPERLKAFNVSELIEAGSDKCNTFGGRS